jgi:hypothetical protein
MHYWKLDYHNNHTHLPFTGSDSLTYVQQCILFRKRETVKQTDRQTERERERERERPLLGRLRVNDETFIG